MKYLLRKNAKEKQWIEYNYTEKYFSRKKSIQKYAFGIAFLVCVSTVIIQNYIPLLTLPIVITLIIWLFAYSGVYREFERDQIYIDENGLITFRKHFTDKFGHPYALCIVKDIKKIFIKKKKIIFHGTIMIYSDGKDQKGWRLAIPKELENVDDLISYAQHNYPQKPQQKTNQWSDPKAKRRETNFREIWQAINIPLGKVVSLALKIFLSTGLIALLCAYMVEIQKIVIPLLIVGMIFIGMFSFLAIVYFVSYIIWEYLIDIAMQRVKKYQGYYCYTQKINKIGNATIYPIRQYNGYSETVFYDQKNVDKEYEPNLPGDLKSNPLDGRRLLVKDLTIFKTVNKKRKMEIYYLPKSKVIVKVRQIEEPEEET